jgi:Ca-activated chloride channel homolog
MNWIKFVSIYILVLIAVTAFAQQERKFIRKGNKLFEKENFQESEIQYRKAIDKDKNSYNALFNIGDALYKQEKYEDATKQFSDLSSTKDLSKDDKAKLYHNIGNSMLKNQKVKESIDAYKEALRNNPNDMDTKHNLAYAQKLMQQQQQQQDQQDKQDENKDQNKDQKEDQQNQNQQNKQDQQQPKISKEDAERLLQALANDEKKTQDKLKKEKAAKVRLIKEW